MYLQEESLYVCKRIPVDNSASICVTKELGEWFFFNLYLPTLFRRDIHVDMCVRRGLRVSKIKKDQEEEEAKDWHCSTSAIATA